VNTDSWSLGQDLKSGLTEFEEEMQTLDNDVQFQVLMMEGEIITETLDFHLSTLIAPTRLITQLCKTAQRQ
jgi:hypothetical protein